MAVLGPVGRVKLVNVRYKEPGRLSRRGGTLFTTRPSNKVPSGSTTREPRRTGSTRRAWNESPGRFLEALKPPKRINCACVPAATVFGRSGNTWLEEFSPEAVEGKAPPVRHSASRINVGPGADMCCQAFFFPAVPLGGAGLAAWAGAADCARARTSIL